MKTTITALSVAAALALGAVAVQAPQDIETLIEQYEEAEEDWQERLQEASTEERREIRKQHPAPAYWGRFDAAAQAGEGRALLWMTTHLRDKGLRSSEIRDEKPILYGQLFERYVGDEWFGQALDALEGDRRYFEDEQLASLYERTIEHSEVADVRAQAMYQLGRSLLASEDAAAREAGMGWLRKASEELGDTPYGKLAYGEINSPVVGQPAPDFTGKTIDGYEFKLSDYRGKVVLLDFYGFW